MSNISAVTDAKFDDLAAGAALWGPEVDEDGLGTTIGDCAPMAVVSV